MHGLIISAFLLFNQTADSIVINKNNNEIDDFLNSEISVNAFFKLGLNKSPGNDGICAEFYIHTRNEISNIYRGIS